MCVCRPMYTGALYAEAPCTARAPTYTCLHPRFAAADDTGCLAALGVDGQDTVVAVRVLGVRECLGEKGWVIGSVTL